MFIFVLIVMICVFSSCFILFSIVDLLLILLCLFIRGVRIVFIGFVRECFSCFHLFLNNLLSLIHRLSTSLKFARNLLSVFHFIFSMIDDYLLQLRDLFINSSVYLILLFISLFLRQVHFSLIRLKVMIFRYLILIFFSG